MQEHGKDNPVPQERSLTRTGETASSEDGEHKIFAIARSDLTISSYDEYRATANVQFGSPLLTVCT